MSSESGEANPETHSISIRCDTCGRFNPSLFHSNGNCMGLLRNEGTAAVCDVCKQKTVTGTECQYCSSPYRFDSNSALITVSNGVSVTSLEQDLRQAVLDSHTDDITIDNELCIIARHVSREYSDRLVSGGADLNTISELGDGLADEIGDRLIDSEVLQFGGPSRITGLPLGDRIEELKDSLARNYNLSNSLQNVLGAGIEYDETGQFVTTIITGNVPELGVEITEIELAIHQKINGIRDDHDLPILDYDDHLRNIARSHSQDMIDRDYFAHVDPEGNDVADRYREHSYHTRQAGENIAKIPHFNGRSAEKFAEETVSGWMNSPEHRENILEAMWNSEGLGAVYNESSHVYITQNFS